jgi:protein-L-isoaspartate O-methyltransferase
MIWVYVLIFIGLIPIVLIRVIPIIKGAPYVRTSDERLIDLLKILGPVKGKKIAELGSGDGKVVIALSKHAAKVDGFEINPMLVRQSQKLLQKDGHKNSQIYLKNLWQVDTSKYDLVVVYGITRIMSDLEKKLQNELKPGTLVASVYFQFPTWKEVKKLGDIHLYKK